MNTNITTAAKLVAFAGAFALTGCAFVPDTVHPTYTPPANVTKVPGADKVVVDVIVKNQKKHKDEVSATKDGLGINMAGVYIHVADDVKTAIDKGLQAKGARSKMKCNTSGRRQTEVRDGQKIQAIDARSAKPDTAWIESGAEYSWYCQAVGPKP